MAIQLCGNTYHVKETIKRLGGKWDKNKKCWVLSDDKEAVAELLASQFDDLTMTKEAFKTSRPPTAAKKDFGNVGKIFTTSWGYGMSINDFCEVTRETETNMWCQELATKNVTPGMKPGTPGYGQYGKEIAIKGSRKRNSSDLIRIKKTPKSDWAFGKSGSGNSSKFWHEWNGEPKSFNYMD